MANKFVKSGSDNNMEELVPVLETSFRVKLDNNAEKKAMTAIPPTFNGDVRC